MCVCAGVGVFVCVGGGTFFPFSVRTVFYHFNVIQNVYTMCRFVLCVGSPFFPLCFAHSAVLLKFCI